MAHAWNPGYLAGRDQEITVPGQSGQKFHATPSQQMAEYCVVYQLCGEAQIRGMQTRSV
jgi:hypothetical protein